MTSETFISEMEINHNNINSNVNTILVNTDLTRLNTEISINFNSIIRIDSNQYPIEERTEHSISTYADSKKFVEIITSGSN